MFLLRAATRADLDALLELSRHLDSPNLPHDEAFLRARLERSERAFAEPAAPDPAREYQLALEDASGRVVGTSVILSKHGTPELPHTFLRVSLEDRCAESVDVRVRHCTLQLGSTEDGPTEIGALVLLPEVRRQAGWPGKLLSWGRFVYVAHHPASFESQIIAEMRAALDPEGRNAFWDAFGKRFTGMSYAEADRRSAHDKSFILELFPDTPFYAALLDEPVASQLGQVHPEAQAALRLLEQAGLHWIGEIDPFDAGPFVGAAVSELIPLRETRFGVLATSGEGAGDDAAPAIASLEDERGFRAVATRARLDGRKLHLPKEAARRLGASEGDALAVTPLPASSRQGGTRG